MISASFPSVSWAVYVPPLGRPPLLVDGLLIDIVEKTIRSCYPQFTAIFVPVQTHQVVFSGFLGPWPTFGVG